MASPSFNVVETTIADVHAAFKAGRLTARQLVQAYLDRIAAYDQKGPAINAIIAKAKLPLIITSSVGRNPMAVAALATLAETFALPVVQAP